MVKAEGVMEGGEGERKAKTARRAIDTAGCGSDVGRQCVWGGGGAGTRVCCEQASMPVVYRMCAWAGRDRDPLQMRGGGGGGGEGDR